MHSSHDEDLDAWYTTMLKHVERLKAGLGKLSYKESQPLSHCASIAHHCSGKHLTILSGHLVVKNDQFLAQDELPWWTANARNIKLLSRLLERPSFFKVLRLLELILPLMLLTAG